MVLFPGKIIKILSIDGGGIRGIIPALVLRDLERRLLEAKRWRPFCSLFDMIAGTSTGGLIALGLALPKKDKEGRFTREPRYRMDDIVEIYETRGVEIFPRWIFNNLRNLVQAFYEKYPSRDIEKVLEDVYGDATLKDALTNLLLTAYDPENRTPFFFKNRPYKKEWDTDLNFYMKDAARATSAAPTYFEPALISPVEEPEKKICLIDGGVFSNNPSMNAYIEARKIFPRARKFMIVSLGTGSGGEPLEYEKLKKWGYIDWIRPSLGTPLFSIMNHGQSESVNHELNKLPEVNFFRINGFLDGIKDTMDDASPKNVEALKKIAKDLIIRFDKDLDRICYNLQG